ncbi:uncharacterized protein LOC136071650 isoform X2 [Hydra vulgaris]|uniref:Uncharacterized protein LOC136071650 isoform X2 n=1 Tax=Hydra vulgaris TaxID=6087 RepID=A0ABM4BC04_HYDVU
MLHDQVHLFKSIRSNWFTEKTQTISLKINDQPLSGDWSHNVQLYNRKKLCVAKTSKLSRKSVYPSLIDRQNVENMVAVFNEKTVAALNLANFKNTACFLAPIVLLWSMLIVKRKGCDVLLNDTNRSSFQTLDDFRFKEILAFADATSKMSEGKRFKHYSTLTPETKHTLVNTLQGLVELIKKLLLEDYRYVLPGIFQTDYLKGEFSIYRQLSCGNYFISAEQVLNSLHLQRLKLFSKLVSLDETDILCSCKHTDCCTMDLMDNIYLECLINADNESINDKENAALFYMVGYVQHKIDPQRVVDTTISQSASSELRDYVSRGNLPYPSDTLFQFVCFCYLLFNSFSKSEKRF